MVREARRERVRQCTDHGRVRIFVNESRKIRIQERVRLLHRNVDRQRVPSGGPVRRRDAILAEPVRYGLDALRLGRHELGNL